MNKSDIAESSNKKRGVYYLFAKLDHHWLQNVKKTFIENNTNKCLY